MKKSFVTFILFLSLGCVIERSTRTEAALRNASTHYITMQGYRFGVATNGDRLELGPGEEIEFGDNQARGKNVDGFSSSHLGDADSVVVTFDQLYKVTHYVHVAPPVQILKFFSF